MDVVPYIFFDVVRFSLTWPLTASSIVVSVGIGWSISVRVPCCKHLLGHTVPHEMSRFSTPKAIVASIAWTGVCFLLLFSKKLLNCCGKDFQLSCYFCFGIVTSFWLGHHEPCFIPFGYIYCCLYGCW